MLLICWDSIVSLLFHHLMLHRNHSINAMTNKYSISFINDLWLLLTRMVCGYLLFSNETWVWCIFRVIIACFCQCCQFTERLKAEFCKFIHLFYTSCHFIWSSHLKAERISWYFEYLSKILKNVIFFCLNLIRARITCSLIGILNLYSWQFGECHLTQFKFIHRMCSQSIRTKQ